MKKIYLLIIPIILISCNTSRKIAYQTDGISAVSNTIPISVCIKELEDIRQLDSANLLLFEKERQIRHEKKSICINSEKHYKKETVALQITQQITNHFNQIKLFDEVIFNDESQADYYITGKLSHFYGMQNFSMKALVGSQFGLVGALMTSGVKTPAEIVIEIKDIALYDKGGNLVKEIGDYRKEYSEELHADGHCWCIYENINRKFKEFNDGLAEKINSELSGMNFSN